MDASVFLAICLIFPLIALVPTWCVAMIRTDYAEPAPDDPRRGGGGPPGPEPTPDPPDGGQPTVTGDNVGLAAGLPGLDEPGPGTEQDWPVAALPDAAIQPAGMR